ncbi:hypothetical protein V1512DRAFT_268689 [Lipomyces arxii]|uniref:uncharacterized protein n=1 Tax=Lipomyces arxii TaxID=56418 RepID=UPI0034CDBBE4
MSQVSYPLSETTSNRSGPVTPRASLTPASKMTRSITRSSLKPGGSGMKRGRSEYNLPSLQKLPTHSSITKPKLHSELLSSSQKSRHSSLALSASRTTMGLSQILQGSDTGKSVLSVDQKFSTTPRNKRTVEDMKDDNDDSFLPSSPFEQYPGMSGHPANELISSPTTPRQPVFTASIPAEHSRTPLVDPVSHSKTSQISQSSTRKRVASSSSKSEHKKLLRTPATTREVYLLDFNTPAESTRLRLTPSNLSSDTTPTQSRPGRIPQQIKSIEEACLLDLDLPIQTPRSLPTVSTRQVESLKAEYLSEIATLKAELVGKESELSALRVSLRDSEERFASMEQRYQDESNRIERIAKELHAQYSKKHETKVLALKKQLEAKWIARLEDSEKLLQHLEKDLEVERQEKADLVKYWDLYLETADQMQSEMVAQGDTANGK